MNLSELYLIDGAFALTIAAASLSMLKRGRGLGRFALPLAFVFILGYAVVPTRSVLSFGSSLFVVGLVYRFRPFQSAVPLACALLVNPFLRYFDALAGFELRLWLTDTVGEILLLFGNEVEVVGNVLWLSGQPFSVDAECVGIYLMLTGLAVSVLCLALAEHQSKRVFRWPIIGVVIVCSFAAVVAANLMRILTLVVTGWGPEHAFHGPVGLLAFAGYVLLPVALGSRWLAKQYFATSPAAVSNKIQQGLQGGSGLSPKPKLRMSPVLWKFTRLTMVMLLAIGLVVFQAHRDVHQTSEANALFGLDPASQANGVFGYSFADAIVYVKPVPAFYHAEHSPTICWRGSGYQFSQIERKALPQGGEVFTARLIRDDVVLYTAWWMDNGAVQTLQQGEWRRRMAVGEASFQLVNVTTDTQEDLNCWIFELYGTAKI